MVVEVMAVVVAMVVVMVVVTKARGNTGVAAPDERAARENT